MSTAPEKPAVCMNCGLETTRLLPCTYRLQEKGEILKGWLCGREVSGDRIAATEETVRGILLARGVGAEEFSSLKEKALHADTITEQSGVLIMMKGYDSPTD